MRFRGIQIKCICPARARNAGSGLYTRFDQNYIRKCSCINACTRGRKEKEKKTVVAGTYVRLLYMSRTCFAIAIGLGNCKKKIVAIAYACTNYLHKKIKKYIYNCLFFSNFLLIF